MAQPVDVLPGVQTNRGRNLLIRLSAWRSVALVRQPWLGWPVPSH